ncbi:hypothetical protein ACLKA6_009036 [Drosophila palustris]
MRLVTRKMKKARDRFKRRRQVKRQVVAAVARTVRSDPRVFAEFSLGGRQMRGLLDSGASVSLLGRGCRELAEELNLPVKPYVSTVRTASGEDRSIIGRLVVPVEYKGEVKDVVLYLCPYLEQTAYLGIDFWRIFGIAPDVVGSEVPVVEAIDENQGMAEQIAHYVEDDGAKSEPEAWELDESQKLVLEEVKAKFLAFEKVGLGKTHAEKHRIELVAGAQPVKDRHYPLSPAMQQVVWDEVDKMLAIGVIEESNSPWSNRTTVVRRPDKNRFCLDARKLNALTVKDAYPLPSIEVADTLSRSLGAEVADLQGSEFDPSEALGFQTNEFQSEEYQELVREVMENKESLPDLKVEGGAIFKKIMVNRLEEELDGSTWKLWVPASLTHELVRRAHEEHTAAHGGVAKTLHALRRQYFWPKMAVQVAEFVRDCGLCKETKATNYRMQVGIGAEVVTERPADRQRLIQEKIQKQLHAAYERSSLRYNERARELHLTPGQEVFRRNFSLSNFSKAYNAKFARKFLKARVVRSVGSNMYELEDEQGPRQTNLQKKSSSNNHSSNSCETQAATSATPAVRKLRETPAVRQRRETRVAAHTQPVTLERCTVRRSARPHFKL